MSDLDTIRQALRDAAFDEALASRLGLNATDLRCLELVLEEPALTAGRLAERSGLTTGAVTGVVDRLAAAGFVTRQPDPLDRRSVTVSPVGARARELRAALEPLSKALNAELAKLNSDERAGIVDFLTVARTAVAEETARLQAHARGGFVGDDYIAQVGGITRGRLVFSSGAPRLAVSFAPFGPRATARAIVETSASRLHFDGAAPAGELIRMRFKGPRPDVRVTGGVASIRYRRAAIDAFSGRDARIQLAVGIPWTIELDGGITDLDGSLAALMVEGIEVEGGANHVTLDLPRPSGSPRLRLSGVASNVRLRRPSGTPVGLTVDGGIAHLRLDGAKHAQVGGRHRFESPGFASSPDRWEVEVLGGASEVRVGAI